MNYTAFIHNDDVDAFIDFIEPIDHKYQLVYKLLSLPYIKIQCVMEAQDVLAAKLMFPNTTFNKL